MLGYAIAIVRKLKINNKNFTGKYIESLEVVDYSGSVGFFIKLRKNISYSGGIASKGNNFVLTLSVF